MNKGLKRGPSDDLNFANEGIALFHGRRINRRPYDEKGRFVSLVCPDEDCDGFLVPEKDLLGLECWRCNGLVDPNDSDKDLEACEFVHIDGEKYCE